MQDFVHDQGERGDVTCTIEVDGAPVASNTATGAYTIATCQGSL